MQPGDEVGGDEPIPSPFGAEDVGQQDGVFAAPVPVDRVVGGHDRCHAGGGHPAEVREVDLVECPLVHGHVDPEPGLLHRVAGEVLHAGHDPGLQAPSQGGRHLADVVWVFAIGLLGATPPGVSEQVHTDRTGVGRSHRPQFGADHLTDPLLEPGIEGGTTGHRHREAGGRPDDAPAGTVGEADPRDAQPSHLGGRPGVAVVPARHHVHDPGPELGVAIEAAELLLVGHFGHQRPRLHMVVSTVTHPGGGHGERRGIGGSAQRARSTWRLTRFSKSSWRPETGVGSMSSSRTIRCRSTSAASPSRIRVPNRPSQPA